MEFYRLKSSAARAKGLNQLFVRDISVPFLFPLCFSSFSTHCLPLYSSPFQNQPLLPASKNPTQLLSHSRSFVHITYLSNTQTLSLHAALSFPLSLNRISCLHFPSPVLSPPLIRLIRMSPCSYLLPPLSADPSSIPSLLNPSPPLPLGFVPSPLPFSSLIAPSRPETPAL